jgi:hypothetical protein
MWHDVGMATDPLDRLRDAVETKRRAVQAETEAIVEALRPGSGVQQKDVIAITGYSRENIRRIARAHGIGPASKGTKETSDA